MRKGAEHASNILDALAKSPKALSAYELLDRLRPTGVTAPLTVYRALEKLMAAGRVHRVESLNAFVACNDTDRHTHHHAHDHTVAFTICDRCGGVDEFVDQGLRDRIHADVAAKSFVPRMSAVEVHGLCAACHAED